MFMYEGDPEIIRAVITRMPPEAGAIINELAPKVYAEYAHAIHGTPTPPRVTAADVGARVKRAGSRDTREMLYATEWDGHVHRARFGRLGG